MTEENQNFSISDISQNGTANLTQEEIRKIIQAAAEEALKPLVQRLTLLSDLVESSLQEILR